jgi:Domain of unknown function (DUF4190)
VSTASGNLPPRPPQSSGPTQIAGQQAGPSTSVPAGPPLYLAAGTAGRTNTLATVSLIAGMGSFFAHIVPGVGGFTVALIAVITGFMARQQIRETREVGMGMANAGIIIGAVHIALLVLVFIGLIFAIFVFGIALFSAHR